MGIGGCWYTGPDGRRRRVEVSSREDFRDPAAGARAPARPPAPAGIPPARRGAGAPRPPMPGSAVTEAGGSLCLRGEEASPLVEGRRVYGSVDGRKGFHTLDEVDPGPGGGPRAGAPFGCADPAPSGGCAAPGPGGVTVPAVSRLRLERDCGVCTLYLYEGDLNFTPGRRLGSTGGERMLEVGTWLDGGRDAPPPMPFDIADGEGGTSSLVRCSFYWRGRRVDLPDAPVERSGTVWLAAGEGDGGEPSFRVTQDDPGEGAAAVRLYDFDAETGAVAADWRASAFLCGPCVERLNGMDGEVEVAAGGGGVALGDGRTLSLRVDTDTGSGTVTVSLEEEAAGTGDAHGGADNCGDSHEGGGASVSPGGDAGHGSGGAAAVTFPGGDTGAGAGVTCCG